MCSRRKLSKDKVSMKKSWLLLKCSEGKLKRTTKGVEDIVNPSVGVSNFERSIHEATRDDHLPD